MKVLKDCNIGELLKVYNWRMRLVNKCLYEIGKIKHIERDNLYDMVLVFTTYLEDEKDEFIITNEQFSKLEKLGFSEDMFYSAARLRTRDDLIKSCIVEMQKVICKDENQKIIEEKETPLFLIRGKNSLKKDYIASMILFNDILEKVCSRFEEGVYVFPQSVSSLFCVPVSKANRDLLEVLHSSQIICNHNVNNFEQFEKLTDEAFYFDYSTDGCGICRITTPYDQYF